MKTIGRIRRPFIILFTLSLVPAMAQHSPGHPLAGLERLKNFETMRASSSDPDWRNGNADARPIPAGGTLVVADLKGPGVITHIWNTIAHDAPNYSRLMTLRMYWDGEAHPSVEAPIGDFFGIGHGIDKSFVSLPIKVSSDGRGRNCYWPMPFRKSARITVSNESDRPCGGIYFYVDWQKHKSLPRHTAYFHAMYRQEFPCVMGRNYLVADLVGRGHYVGTIQSVQMMSPGWYGEGDDFFFIDGEAEPRLRGTGTEDYFCDGWGFHVQDGPFYGTPLWEGYDTGHHGTAYRFHIPDPVTFTKSLRVEIEHKGSQRFPDGTETGFIERDDLMSSVALWYQTEPHKPWPALPPGPERLFERTLKLCVGWQAVPDVKHSGAPIGLPKLACTKESQALWFKPSDANGWLEIPFKLDQEAKGNLWGRFVASKDYGIYRVSLDGEELAIVDLYAEKTTSRELDWGRRTLGAGPHVLRFECQGKAEASKGWFFGFDRLDMPMRAYERPADFDLRRIQVPK
ncbi:MAG TPA: DUF2961 domain-containing protein [Verrucomicrobiota bacterium]|jgi:hypothetical protein|nr:MAG: hypothetical protein BWX48_03410 [Verrucomicrobia bacterium ADurb.Bin006]HOF49966.1 DUF2961 domain-containing protein [Verrucomicrobiota bacterium]HOR73070.1 DUF2961 domain-containing protein [Verrucomicrobiota bacterium]HPK99597.1 DUF2961 domain-containing protein [Verrucomicrobiota bacterium]HPV12352.1 DUF2961 domain-containing protein [Verrucomicrobiota bacterium]